MLKQENREGHPLLNIRDLTMLTARLAQILAEEADLLQNMKIKEIEKLQKEKVLIANALDVQKKHLERNPEVMENITDEERADLRSVVEIFQGIMSENHRRLLIAKEVNNKVVEAIAEVVSDTNTNSTYDDCGVPSLAGKALSVTLNEMI